MIHVGLTNPGRSGSIAIDRLLAMESLGIFALFHSLGADSLAEGASRGACEAFEQALAARETGAAASAMQRAVDAANRCLVEASMQRGGPGASSASMEAIRIAGGQATLAHVGDCRAFLLRGGRLRRLTVDHCAVLKEVRRSDSHTSLVENVVERVVAGRLGVQVAPPVDWQTLPVKAGDTLLLCNDGLWEFLSRERIRELLMAHVDQPENAGQALLDAAVDAQGDKPVALLLLRMPGESRIPLWSRPWAIPGFSIATSLLAIGLVVYVLGGDHAAQAPPPAAARPGGNHQAVPAGGPVVVQATATPTATPSATPVAAGSATIPPREETQP